MAYNQEIKALGSWHITNEQSHLGHGIQPRNKATWVMAYNQETKPLGSWHIIHQPRNKATWDHGILLINQETKPLGSWHTSAANKEMIF